MQPSMEAAAVTSSYKSIEGIMTEKQLTYASFPTLCLSLFVTFAHITAHSDQIL